MEYPFGEIGRHLHEVANAMVESGLFELAERAYQLAIDLDSDDFRSITNLAVLLDKTGRHFEAEELYLRTAGAPFFDEVAMFNLGYLYSRTEKPALAESWYQRALVAKPDYSEAMVNLAGVILKRQGDLLEVKQLLENALRISPRDSIAVQELANIYRLMGDPFLAEMLYRRAVSIEESSALSNFNLASFLEEEGQSEEADFLFDRAYKLDPEGNLKKGEV